MTITKRREKQPQFCFHYGFQFVLVVNGMIVSFTARGKSCKLYPPSRPNNIAEPKVSLMAVAMSP